MRDAYCVSLELSSILYHLSSILFPRSPRMVPQGRARGNPHVRSIKCRHPATPDQ